MRESRAPAVPSELESRYNPPRPLFFLRRSALFLPEGRGEVPKINRGEMSRLLPSSGGKNNVWELNPNIEILVKSNKGNSGRSCLVKKKKGGGSPSTLSTEKRWWRPYKLSERGGARVSATKDKSREMEYRSAHVKSHRVDKYIRKRGTLK